jgi:hypothetical protein
MSNAVRTSLASLLFAACAAPPIGDGGTPPIQAKTNVDIDLASVTLADDCPDPTPAPVEPPANGGFAKPPPGASITMDDSVGYAPRRMMMCEQTSMQLSLRASNAGTGTSVRVKRVELFDDRDRMIGTLAARNATAWSNDGSYMAWDQTMDPGELVSASYSLSAPDWSVLDGGRWAAAARTFTLRVTFTVGDQDRMVEKQATVAAMIEPHVVT